MRTRGIHSSYKSFFPHFLLFFCIQAWVTPVQRMHAPTVCMYQLEADNHSTSSSSKLCHFVCTESSFKKKIFFLKQITTLPTSPVCGSHFTQIFPPFFFFGFLAQRQQKTALYGDSSSPFFFPSPPATRTVTKEQLHIVIKEILSHCCILIVKGGLVVFFFLLLSLSLSSSRFI